MAGKPGRERVVLTHREFLEAWEAADSLDEFCQKTGKSPASAQAKASEYRGLGVPIKKFGRAGVPQATAEELQKILAEVRHVTVGSIVKEAVAMASSKEGQEKRGRKKKAG